MNKIDYLIQKYSTGNKVTKPERMAQSAVDFFDSAREYWNRATSGNFLDRLWTRWTADDQSAAKTFDEAYSNARKNGSKTFIWNNKHYSTDYSGEHHKKYEEDIKSGKAAAWEDQYPNFTNPELRKAKQEELDTYGITNEQTKNKTFKDRMLRKIPARGYNISDALSAIKGEYHYYMNYSTPKELTDAIKKKYPEFQDFEFKVTHNMWDPNTLVFDYDISKLEEYSKNVPAELQDKWTLFYNDLNNRSNYHYGPYSNKTFHDAERDLLLGYPMSGDDKPYISKYRTGSESYYYTHPYVENGSLPFLTKSMWQAKAESDKVFAAREAELERMRQSDIYKNFPSLDPYVEQYNNFDDAYTEWQIDRDQYIKKHSKFFDKFLDFDTTGWSESEKLANEIYDNPEVGKYWGNLGVSTQEGGVVMYDWGSLKKATNSDLKRLSSTGIFRDVPNILGLPAGNHVVRNGNASYYQYEDDIYTNDDKYSRTLSQINKWWRKISGNSTDLNKQADSAIDVSKYRLNGNLLGSFTLGIPKDGSFVSVYDKFDLDPFGMGNDKPLIKIGKPFEYYTRFYKNAEPNIDSLYNNFQWKKQ